MNSDKKNHNSGRSEQKNNSKNKNNKKNVKNAQIKEANISHNVRDSYNNTIDLDFDCDEDVHSNTKQYAGANRKFCTGLPDEQSIRNSRYEPSRVNSGVNQSAKRIRKDGISLDVDSLVEKCDMKQFMKMVRAHQFLFPEYLHWKMVFKYYRFETTGPNEYGMYRCSVYAKRVDTPPLDQVSQTLNLSNPSAGAQEEEFAKINDLYEETCKQEQEAEDIERKRIADSITCIPDVDEDCDKIQIKVVDAIDVKIETAHSAQLSPNVIVDDKVEHVIIKNKGECYFIPPEGPLISVGNNKHIDPKGIGFPNDVVHCLSKNWILEFPEGFLKDNPCRNAFIGCAMTSIASYIADHTGSDVLSVFET